MTFEVVGAPATKGSTRSFPFRKGDGSLGVRVTPDNVTLRAWETRVRAEAVAAMVRDKVQLIPRPGAVRLVAVFRLPRPMKFSTPKYQSGRAFAPAHTSRPDCSKLLRAVEDAMIGAVFEDDAQLESITVSKRYAHLGEPWGVRVSVYGLGGVDAEEDLETDHRQGAHNRQENRPARGRAESLRGRDGAG